MTRDIMDEVTRAHTEAVQRCERMVSTLSNYMEHMVI